MDNALKILNGLFKENMTDTYFFRVCLVNGKYKLVTFEASKDEETCFISEANKDEFEKRLWTFITGVLAARDANKERLLK